MNTPVIHSRVLKGIIIVLGVLIVLLVVFRLGMIVGFKEASYSYEWGDNYYRDFGGPKPGTLAELGPGQQFIQPHGTTGDVITVDQADIVVKDDDGAEKIIEIASTTPIMLGRTQITISGIHTDDNVVIIGEPDASGTIAAQFIRVLR